MFSPSFCHRFSGYLEEEAIFNYTIFLRQLDAGKLPKFQNMPAPQLGIDYYNLPEDAKLRDLVLCIRADEAMHREFNHYFAELGSKDEVEVLEIDKATVETRNVTS